MAALKVQEKIYFFGKYTQYPTHRSFGLGRISKDWTSPTYPSALSQDITSSWKPSTVSQTGQCPYMPHIGQSSPTSLHLSLQVVTIYHTDGNDGVSLLPLMVIDKWQLLNTLAGNEQVDLSGSWSKNAFFLLIFLLCSSEDTYHSHSSLHTGETQWEEAGGLTVEEHLLSSMPTIQFHSLWHLWTLGGLPDVTLDGSEAQRG